MPSIVRELCGMESPPKALGGPQQKGTSTNDPACPIARGTNRRLFKHDDSVARHLAVPPARRSPVLGIRPPRVCPLCTSKCNSLRSPLRATLHPPAHQSIGDEMHHLHPHRHWPDCTK